MRADVFLFENGYFESREKAKKAIESSRVVVGGKTLAKPSADIAETDEIFIVPSDKSEYVGRGGIKLEYALDVFGIDPSGKRAIDIGASTGGFTDCLLQRGAKYVYAVDIGHGQLHPSLAADKRVKNLEGINARELSVNIVEGAPVELAVSDLSFISQKLVIPNVKNVLASGGIYIVLVKPQFEAGREHIGKNGIVKSDKVRQRVLNDIIEFTVDDGYELIGSTLSPIEGGSGNIEFLAVFRRIG